MKVSIEQDAAYRRDGASYVEQCRACKRDRAGDTCACGEKFMRLERKVFSLAMTPTSITPRMPDTCPHCDGPTDRVRSITIKVATKATLGGAATYQTITLEVPSCKRMLPPFAAYLLFIFSMFWVVVFGLVALFGTYVAFVPLVVALAGAFASWRAYGWIRFARVDHRSLRFRVRRASYAARLAEQNDGRVL
jgi:hypothetical protein